MRATYLIAIALILLIIGRWAHNKPAFDIKTVAAAVVLLFVVALLDQGRTEPVAQGLAWLILMGVVLSPASPVTAIAGVITSKHKASSAVAKNMAAHGVGGDPGTTT